MYRTIFIVAPYSPYPALCIIQEDEWINVLTFVIIWMLRSPQK